MSSQQGIAMWWVSLPSCRTPSGGQRVGTPLGLLPGPVYSRSSPILISTALPPPHSAVTVGTWCHLALIKALIVL